VLGEKPRLGAVGWEGENSTQVGATRAHNVLVKQEEEEKA
jgi:hypothetical protein